MQYGGSLWLSSVPTALAKRACSIVSAECTIGLPYGIQKIVGLGRALAMEPTILLLDEPSAGMTHQEKEDLARFIMRIKFETGITMIWVEHDMQMVGDLADRIVVLNFGTKIAEGLCQDVLCDRTVIDAYLGSKRDDQCGPMELEKDKNG